MKCETSVWTPFRRQAYRREWCEKKILGIVKEFGRDLRRCHERIWHGYCDYDLFSIDDSFLGIMPSMLQEFRDNLHGCPVSEDYISHKVWGLRRILISF